MTRPFPFAALLDIPLPFLFVLAAGMLLCMTAPGASAAEAEEGAAGPYRHVVLFAFKESSSREDVAGIEKAFAALKDKIDLIQDYEWGTNVSPEGLDDGFTHCFFVTFKNKADLEKYLPHPEHKKFVELLKPHLEKVLVVDYVARETAE